MMEILEELGHEVTLYNREDIEESQIDDMPDLYVLWQSDRLLPLLANKNKPILCIPMLDDALPLTVSHFRSVNHVKYVSFSKTMHRFLTLSGCDSSYIQFWPKIVEVETLKDIPIFFWERNPSQLNLHDVVRNINNKRLNILVRQLPDPHDLRQSEFWSKNNQIQFLSKSWIAKEEYIGIVARSQVFVSSRPWEGIGLSFLEAMSMGCCVVGFNNPTMNEYIESGITGILIRNRSTPIDLSDAQAIGNRAREAAREGSIKFQSSCNEFFTGVLDIALNGKAKRKMRFLPDNLSLRKYIFLRRLR